MGLPPVGGGTEDLRSAKGWTTGSRPVADVRGLQSSGCCAAIAVAGSDCAADGYQPSLAVADGGRGTLWRAIDV